jgi:glycosyltransferase involved in cell wall biosynthesis
MKQAELKPKVSVCVITYNHEKYLRQCLQSIVDQVTEFEFEVIIGDDCSTDGTSEIIREFWKVLPDKIIPIFHQKNIGGNANLVSVYKKATGKYIAHIDGDDYMGAGKLQRQFEILEKNADCHICTHDMKVIDKYSKVIKDSFQKHEGGIFSLIDLYQNLPFFAHSSKMFINELSFCDDININTVDIEIHVAQATVGGIYHIVECLGAYRVGVGVTQTSGRVNLLIPAATRRVFAKALGDRNLTKSDEGNIRRYFSKSILNYSYQSALIGNRSDCRMYALESMRIQLISVAQLILFLASFLPFGLRYLATSRSHRQ